MCCMQRAVPSRGFYLWRSARYSSASADAPASLHFSFPFFSIAKWGVPKIHVISIIGSKAGLQQLLEQHPEIQVTVGTVDGTVNDDGVVLPGLGDAGDRLFGTSEIPEEEYMNDDEALLHPSKRKRTMSQG